MNRDDNDWLIERRARNDNRRVREVNERSGVSDCTQAFYNCTYHRRSEGVEKRNLRGANIRAGR